MRRKLTLLIAAALLTLAAADATAQMRGERHDRHEIPAFAQELIGELKSWARADVLPSLQSWKNRLDASMAPDDLAKLNDLRARASSLRQRAMQNGRAMHEAWKGENYEALKANRETMKGIGKEYRSLLEELKPLAAEYRTTLEAIGADAKPKATEWKNDAKQIVMTWLAAHKDELAAMGEKKDGLRHLKMLGGLGHAMNRMKVAAHFMLWDGTDFIDQAEQMMQRGGLPDLD